MDHSYNPCNIMTEFLARDHSFYLQEVEFEQVLNPIQALQSHKGHHLDF